MTTTAMTYLLYLAISIALTVWVARTLHKNGRSFLVDAFHGNKELADSVNHLLVVGFYLINLGYVVLALRLRFGIAAPQDFQSLLEFLSFKIGIVMVVLGAMHFGNLFFFSYIRRRAEMRRTMYPRPQSFKMAGESLSPSTEEA